MKTIICPNYLKNDYLNKLLENSNFLAQTKVIPLQALLPEKKYSDEAIYLSALQKLCAVKDKLTVYKEMLQYPAFIMEMADFTKEVILYDIKSDSLKTDTLQQLELKTIIKTLIDLPFNEHNFKKIDLNLPDLEIVDFFADTAFEYNLKEKLLKNHRLIPVNIDRNPNKSLKYALNKREEIEAVAQDICFKKAADKTTIVCSDLSNQLPIIIQVFNRYNIPIKNVSLHKQSPCISKFLTLCNLAVKKDIDSLTDFIHLYQLNNKQLFFDYVNRCINTPEELNEEIFPDSFIEEMYLIKEDRNIILNDLNILLNSNFKEILINGYNILLSFNWKDEKKTMSSIRRIIEDTIHNVNDLDDLNMVIHLINKIKLTTSDSLENGVTITSFNKPVFNNDYVYVIGCTSKLYPGFKGLSGIFDEKYVENTNYPPLATRYENYLKQFSWVDKSADKELIYSFHKSDLSGKTMECAFELENILKPTKWNLISINSIQEKKHFIDPKTARQLFFQNNYLYGSISSLESFYNCPYKYFINHGLKIKENPEKTIGPDTIGNIIHKLMQETVIKNPKHYYEENMDYLLNKLKYALLNDFPKEKDYIDLLFANLKHNLSLNFIYLKEMEKDTSFKAAKAEFKFNEYEILENKVKIKGFIDRIDTAYNLIRIIDYKTGNHELSISKVEKGLSLQLVTYLTVASDLFNKKPVGAFYFNFTNSYINRTFNHENDTVLKEFIKNKRMNGIILEEDLTSLTSTDLKTFYAKKPYNPKQFISQKNLTEGIKTVLNNLYDKLSCGNIDPSPAEETKPCTYCPYSSICRYYKDTVKKENLFKLKGVLPNEVE